MRVAPPQKFAHQDGFKKSLIVSALLLAFSIGASWALPRQVIDKTYLANDGKDDQYKTSFTTDETFDAINLPDFTPPSRQSQFAVYVINGASLTITGDTYIDSFTSGPPGSHGTYAITAGNYHPQTQTTGLINLEGNIEIYVKHAPGMTSSYGANAIYSAFEGSVINLGSEGTSTTIWSFDLKPDAISTKNGGAVHFISTNNKLVGSIDMIGDVNALRLDASEVTGTFSGKSSYWYGDDQSFGNTDVGTIPILGQVLANKSKLELTFSNGAQWSYFGLTDSVSNGSLTLNFTPKRISKIRLLDGGIINLHDEILEHQWKQIGIWDSLDESARGKHDYVRIGDLKGNGGVFYLDLDASDKSQSDMVFIENSTEAGTHFIEPYNLEKLESVNYDNTLTFALTQRGANDVSFSDKVNYFGQSLYDYELEIASDTIERGELDNIDFTRYEDFNSDNYTGGTRWFIQRIIMSKSAAALAMTGAGFASYDAAIEMDRRDRRLLQTFKDDATGLWVRARHGERGVDNEYSYQLDGAAVGIDRQLSDTNTLGFAFTYEEGDTDFESVRGKGDMKRYELAIYDTYDFGAPYIDLVGRLGMVSSDYNAYNQSATLKTSGDFDQKYASLSAEVGYTLMDNHGVFIEPQLQLQVAYLDGYDYSSDRNMKVDVDSEVAVLSRIGLRAGKHFDSSTINGEIYGRADVYHQFTDGQDAVFSDPTHKMHETWGTNKTYASVGLGSYLKVNDKWGLQFDIEKNMGGKTMNSWLITGQAKYQF